MRTRLIGMLLAGLALPFAAYAAQKEEVEKVVSADNAAAFDGQAAAVRKQMEQGGRYEFVTPAERDTVEQRLDEIAGLLAQHQGQAAMPDDAKTRLYIAQEDVNAVLTRRDGRRVVCEHVAKTGTHRKQKECTTYGEREVARRESERYLRESRMKSSCLGTSCDPAAGLKAGKIGRTSGDW